MNPGTDRPDINLYFMRMARLVASRSTCLRRAVGCVLVDERNHVLSTGYNGVPAGDEHCNEMVSVGVNYKDLGRGVSMPSKMVDSYPHACLIGAQAAPGTQLNNCRAVHAEQNALLQCRDPYAIHSIFVTTAPCDSCSKLFMNTSAAVIFVGVWYFDAQGNSNEQELKNAWKSPRVITLDARQ